MLSTQDTLSETYLSICKNCGGRLVCDPDTNESVCGSCGTVCESADTPFASLGSWSPGAIPRPIAAETAHKMTYDIDLPTVIGNRNVDARGNGIYDSYELNRLRKLDNLMISRDSKRRSLAKAIETIKRATEMLGAGDGVAEAAYEIYRKCNEGRGMRRKAIADIALASVYVALKELGIARSVHEIDQVTKEMNARSVRHYYNFLLNELKIRSTSSDASFFVSRIAAKAGLSGKIERRAIDILLRVKDNPVLISKKPVPLAACALYLAAELCGEPVTQLRVASASEVTPVTIRKRSMEILEILQNCPQAEGALQPKTQVPREKALEELLTMP